MNPYFNLLITEVRSAKASHDWKSVKHLIYHIHLFQMGREEATEVLHYISELLRWALLQESCEDWNLWEWDDVGSDIDKESLFKYLDPISPCGALFNKILSNSRRLPVPPAFFMDKSYLMDYLMGDAGDKGSTIHLQLLLVWAADHLGVQLETHKSCLLHRPSVENLWDIFWKHWTKEQERTREDLEHNLWIASLDIGFHHNFRIEQTMSFFLRSET